MLEDLIPIRTTPTGIYFRMADGRIGYANHQYARVSVTREGYRNGKYYREDCEIGDRMYQINRKIKEYNKDNTYYNYVRVKYNGLGESMEALHTFNCQNCGEGAIEYRKNKLDKMFAEHNELGIRSYLTRDVERNESTDKEYNKVGWQNAYNKGHEDGYDRCEAHDKEYYDDKIADSFERGLKKGLKDGYKDGIDKLMENCEDRYNEGFDDGVQSIENKINKLLKSL